MCFYGVVFGESFLPVVHARLFVMMDMRWTIVDFLWSLYIL